MRLLGNGEVSYYYSYRKLSHNVDKTSFNQKKWTAVMEMWCKKKSFTEGKSDEKNLLKSDVKRQTSSLNDKTLLNEAGSVIGERGSKPDLQELKNMHFKSEQGNSGEDNSTRGVDFILKSH